jgi:DNA polymerase-3 subunit gamma/tau
MSAKYKVYIIDEVHMLTREAFNALLKTLEEPPAHVVFILATTDAHKLPETIISRTQRFTFRPVEQEKVTTHLKQIAKQEKINIHDDALALLARHGEGSFRDSISLLDQAGNHGSDISLQDVQNLLGIAPAEALDGLLGSLAQGSREVMRVLGKLYEQGYQAAGIAKQLGERLRTGLGDRNTALGVDDTLKLLGQLIEVPVSHDPERYLEIVLLEHTVPPITKVQQTAPVRIAAQPKSKPEAQYAPEPDSSAALVTALKEAAAEPQEDEVDAPMPTTVSGIIDLTIWPEVLGALKKKHNTVYSIARMGQPSLTEDGKLRLSFAFAFHQKRINDAKNRKLLADTIQELTGAAVAIECVYDKELAINPPENAAPIVATTPPAADLSTISNIFGGGELLES